MEQVRLLQGGMNLDDSVEIIDSNDWLEAANIVSGRAYERKNLEKENVRGTTAITPPVSVDITDSTPIGVIRSAEDDVSYIFYYNSTASKNCIIKLESGALSRVLTWDGLNFSLSSRINGGGIADGHIYFTDDNNQPRCVSLTKYTDGSTPANEEEILHIKRGPIFPPNYQPLGSAGNINYDYAMRDAQFAYQYQYAGGQLSVTSPWSVLLIAQGDDQFGNSTSAEVGISTDEPIPELVTRIKFLARKGNNGAPFYIGDMEPTFTQGDYPISYVEQNLGVVPTRYLQNAELVPLLAGSSCITKSRAWFGNYLEGYDTPTTGVTITGVLEDDFSAGTAGITHSRNSKFKLGVVFSDDQGRSAGVMHDDWGYETPKQILTNIVLQHYAYQITGTPPSWAKYYAPVITKDIVKREFYEGFSVHNTGSYIYVTQATGSETGTSTFSGSTKYVRLNMLSMNFAGIYYSFKEGDVALITNNDDPSSVFGPLKVRLVVGDYIYIDPVDTGGSSPFQYQFQVYTPNTDSEGIFYEIGQRREIIGGVMDTSDYIIFGDSIARNTNTPSNTGFNLSQMRFKPNDGNWDRNLGKLYVKTDIGQVRKSNFVRHSSTFIPGIGVNGLSEFSSGDEGNVPIDAVQIQKLQPTSKESTDGEVILAICNSDTYSIYIDEARLSTSDNQSFLIGATKVIGDIRKQRSGYGTLNPESVHEEEGDVFWWDRLARTYVRYATNGIFPISEYKAVNYFERQAVLNDSSDLVFTGYDPFYKLILVTFANADTTTKKTIGFSLTKDRWISFYDFAPEGYAIGSNVMYSLKDGVVYSHDAVGNLFNTFYKATQKILAPNTGWVSVTGPWVFGSNYLEILLGSSDFLAEAYQPVIIPIDDSTEGIATNIDISGSWTGRIDISLFLVDSSDVLVSNVLLSQHTVNTLSPFTRFLNTATGEAAKLYVRVVFTAIPIGNPTVRITISPGTTLYADNRKDSALEFSFNDDPSVPKEWKAIQLQTSPNMYSFSGGNQVIPFGEVRAFITNRHGQATDIRHSEFEVDENMIYGEIRGDANSTGGILDGDPIYSNTLQCNTTFSGGSYKQLVMAKAGCEPSRGHNL